MGIQRIVEFMSLPYSAIEKLPTAAWEDLAHDLLTSLAKELKTNLVSTRVLLPEPGEIQPGFTMSFQAKTVQPACLGVRLEGVLGLQTEEHETRGSASVFMFVGDDRVLHPGHDYYELTLVSSNGERSLWTHPGWSADVHGEFESITKWGELSQ